ncbi:MAG: hypothetical protein JWQ35_914 [Bacteriovoracaceae bacterium]|nr:hypothetical protein [Bacteriovoracaceae bacterium]
MNELKLLAEFGGYIALCIGFAAVILGLTKKHLDKSKSIFRH